MAIHIDSASLRPVGPSLTLRLTAGRTLGIFGPCGSGKSALARVLAGLDKPARGKISLPGGAAFGSLDDLPRRATPLSLVQRGAGPNGTARAAEALTATRMWERRKEPLIKLSDSDRSACELAAVLASPLPFLVLDGHLDRLDPWTLPAVLDLLGKRLLSGSTLAFATNRPEFARRVDTLVVLCRSEIVFAGSLTELERRFPAAELEVETIRQPGVQALVAPFEVELAATPSGLRMRAKEGQALAARLLAEGYGDVKAVVLRQPEPDELLQRLLAGR